MFPELTVTGYPPEDLLLKPAFVAAAAETVAKLAARTGACAAVIGFPERVGDDLYNAAAVCANGRVLGVYRKQRLPNYAVFDEQRYFTASTEAGPDLRRSAACRSRCRSAKTCGRPSRSSRWSRPAPSSS